MTTRPFHWSCEHDQHPASIFIALCGCVRPVPKVEAVTEGDSRTPEPSDGLPPDGLKSGGPAQSSLQHFDAALQRLSDIEGDDVLLPKDEAMALLAQIAEFESLLRTRNQVNAAAFLRIDEQATEISRRRRQVKLLTRGLLHYAKGHHYTGMDDWEEVEGWLCPPDGESWMVEEGGYAASILRTAYGRVLHRYTGSTSLGVKPHQACATHKLPTPCARCSAVASRSPK